MKFTNNLYTENEKMVKRITSKVASQHGLQTEELLGDAFEILVNTAKKFDNTKGIKFSTWLSWQLKHLHTCALRVKGVPQQVKDVELLYTEELFLEALGNIDFTYQQTELLGDIALDLSTNSQLYLKDLLNGYYTKSVGDKGGRPNKYPIPLICEKYNWSRKEALSVRTEITTWWNEYRMVA